MWTYYMLDIIGDAGTRIRTIGSLNNFFSFHIPRWTEMMPLGKQLEKSAKIKRKTGIEIGKIW